MNAIVNREVVYLTFDDGPLHGTDDVISVLESKRVRGTLFMVASHASSKWRRDQLTAARSSKFVQVGNHSWYHGGSNYHKYYGNPEYVLREFNKANQTLGLTGNAIPARFPGRNTWRLPTWSVIDGDNGQDSRAAAELLFNAGFRIYGWDIEWEMTDKGEAVGTPLSICARINTLRTFRVSGGLCEVVLLTHDAMFKDSAGGKAKLAQLIDMLQDAGYSFDFISNFRGKRPFPHRHRPIPIVIGPQ